MTSGVTARIRLVRCPRCLHLLPEIPEFTVYKCGGCDAILQAKSRKTDIGNLESGVERDGSAQTTESDHVSDDKDLNLIKNDTIFLSSEETLPTLNNKTEKIEFDDNGPLKPVNSNSDCNLKNGTESLHSENEPTILEGDVGKEDLIDEVISSEIHRCSTPVQLEQPRDDDLHPGSERGTNCPDNLDTELVEHNPAELNGGLPQVTNYPVKSCLAEEGSIISDDEKLDQLPEQHLNLSQNIQQASSDFLSEEERAREDKFFVRNLISRLEATETELRRRSFQSNLSDNNQYDFKEYHTNGLQIGNQPRFGREKYSSKDLSYGRGSENGDGNYSIMYPEMNDSYCEKFLDPEDEKMNLLRLVNQLQDQLNKSCNFNGNAYGFVSGPASRKTPHEEMLRDLYHSENLGRYAGSGYGYQTRHQHTSTRIPFSGGASSSGSQFAPAAYFHPHRHEIQRPMLLHPRFNPDHNSYSSCPSSPQRCLSSRYKNQEVHKYSRERYRQVAKRHLRPMAGGAPFITCYSCFKPLQIPADFLLFKRRRHRLRCGACSEVLEFFLQSRNHIAPCLDPPIESDEYSDYVYEQNRPSASYAGDPVSCSEDYGLSSSLSNVPPPQQNSKAGNFSTEMSRSSPKVSGSPLHRLMGYSSISQILNRSGRSETKVQKRG